MMVFDKWQKDADGKITVYPLLVYETFVPHGVLCGLKLHYSENPEQLLAGELSSVPLVMTPDLARQLAAALETAADEAEHGPTGETAH